MMMRLSLFVIIIQISFVLRIRTERKVEEMNHPLIILYPHDGDDDDGNYKKRLFFFFLSDKF